MDLAPLNAHAHTHTHTHTSQPIITINNANQRHRSCSAKMASKFTCKLVCATKGIMGKQPKDYANFAPIHSYRET